MFPQVGWAGGRKDGLQKGEIPSSLFMLLSFYKIIF